MSLPSHQRVLDGGWHIADHVERSYDLEGMQVGTVASGRIGLAVLRRLAPFDVGLHYYDKHRRPAEVEAELLAADVYEVDDYQRVSVVLRSGDHAWVAHDRLDELLQA